MHGPEILARTLSRPVPTGSSGESWQYHPRGDRHSKAACWGILLDLLIRSRTLRRDVQEGRVGFGINHEMHDFRQNRKKNLDLVVCEPAPERSTRRMTTFAKLAERYAIELDDDSQSALASLPIMNEAPVGAVRIALEAKACMTAHVKALPRLHDELNSSHQTVHGAGEFVIASGFVMVNLASEFVSPGRVGYCPNCEHRVAPVTQHKQPEDARRVVEKISELPRRASHKEDGFDALGIVVVNCRNDGSPVTIVSEQPAPTQGSIFHYDSMIYRLAQVYDSRFG